MKQLIEMYRQLKASQDYLDGFMVLGEIEDLENRLMFKGKSRQEITQIVDQTLQLEDDSNDYGDDKRILTSSENLLSLREARRSGEITQQD